MDLKRFWSWKGFPRSCGSSTMVILDEATQTRRVRRRLTSDNQRYLVGCAAMSIASCQEQREIQGTHAQPFRESGPMVAILKKAMYHQNCATPRGMCGNVDSVVPVKKGSYTTPCRVCGTKTTTRRSRIYVCSRLFE
jgi:hypothetical protein